MTIAELRSIITHTQDAVGDLEERVDRLDHAIRGNGKHGLVTQVALLDRRVSDFEDFVAEIRGLRRWMAVGAISFGGNLVWRAIEAFLQGVNT